MGGKTGMVYLHRLVMAHHIKRALYPNEVVHHIDGNPCNNEIDNLLLFPSEQDHIDFHFGEWRFCGQVCRLGWAYFDEDLRQDWDLADVYAKVL